MKLEPIYTEKTQCQDCYKCVRDCPVQAIRVVSGAMVVRVVMASNRASPKAMICL